MQFKVMISPGARKCHLCGNKIIKGAKFLVEELRNWLGKIERYTNICRECAIQALADEKDALSIIQKEFSKDWDGTTNEYL